MGVPAISFAPADLAQQSMQATQLGSWLNTGATALDTVGQTVGMMYQSRVASNNAALAHADAEATLSAGNFEAQRSRMRTGQLISAQKTAQAGNNIDVNTGTPLRVREATQGMGDLDAEVIKYNAVRGAYSSKLAEQSYRSQATAGRIGSIASAIGGGVKTYASYLAGSNALRNQKLMFGEFGVQ